MTRLRPLRLLLASATGLALAAAFPPLNVPLLAWISLAGLMRACLGASPGLALLGGFLHGAAFYTFTLSWVYTVMRVHGGLAVAPAAGVLALLVAVMSLFPAAFALGLAYLGRRSALRALFAAPFLWVAVELARMHVPLHGLPWNLLGYAVADHLGLLQIVSWTGIYGLSFVVAAYNAMLAAMLAGRARRAWTAGLAATVVLLAVALLGHRFVPLEQPRHLARLVQTNFPQSPSYPADWMERHAADLDELERLSIGPPKNSVGLVVWPEVPAPFSLQDPKFAVRAERIARASQNHFLVGIVDWEPVPGGGLAPYNGAALLDPTGRRVFLYDKIHLVPFGEYVPLRRWLTFAKRLTAEVGDFQPGSAYSVAEVPGGKFGVFICFEAIFPAEVGRFVTGGAELLLNLSNDGWFGRSAAPDQHLAMARVRAAENRRWLLRATNTGYTVAVDPYGRYRAQLEPDRRGALEAPYDFRSDLTLYSRLGDWWAWLCVGATALACVRRK